MSNDWVRARTPSQIDTRIDEVVEAAARLFENVEVTDISLAMIARSARWTRSNLYRYFKTKEEIYLELLSRDMVTWSTDISNRSEMEKPVAGAFASALTEWHLDHERMIRLWSVAHTVLEEGASDQRLAEHRGRRFRAISIAAQALSQALPFAGPGAASNFLLAQLALLAGIYPMWSLDSKRSKVLEQSGVPHDPNYFRELFTRSTEALLESSLLE